MIKKFLLIILILDGMAVNVGVGYAIYKSSTTLSVPPPKSNFQFAPNVVGGGGPQTEGGICGVECQKYIDDKIAAIPVATSSSTVVKETKTVVQQETRAKVKSVQYVTIPGTGGSNNSAVWKDVVGSDFYLDKADYPGLVEAYFESNVRLINGSGMAMVQLVDVTHGITVQGADAMGTNSNTDTIIVSGKLNFWAGKNLYRVQIKSLTSEMAVYNSGRLKIVTEN